MAIIQYKQRLFDELHAKRSRQAEVLDDFAFGRALGGCLLFRSGTICRLNHRKSVGVACFYHRKSVEFCCFNHRKSVEFACFYHRKSVFLLLFLVSICHEEIDLQRFVGMEESFESKASYYIGSSTGRQDVDYAAFRGAGI